MTIVSALTARGVELRKVGEDRYVLRCVAHEDDHLSAVLDNRKGGRGRRHCFACGYAEGEIGVLVTMGMTMREAHQALGRPDRDRPATPVEPAYDSCPVAPPCDCDGPFGCQSCTYAPPRAKRTPGAMVLACCRPGCSSTVELVDRQYRNGQVEPWYVQTPAGWECASDLIAAVCPDCIERIERRSA